MSAAPASTSPVPMKVVISHMVPTFLMGLFMTFAYLAGFHRPAPHEVPIAVVGPQAVTGPVMEKLQAGLGDMVSLRALPDSAAAREALRHLEIAGAFIPGREEGKVLLAPAASDTTAMVVQRMFEAVSHKTGLPISYRNVVPLSSNDPVGQNAFFFLVVISVTSYALSIAIAAAGATRSWRERRLLALAAALAITLIEGGVAAGLFGMFAGHVPAVLGISFLYSLAVLLVGIGLHPLLERYSTMIYATVFVGLNFTSSGGVFEPFMQPRFFDALNQFWIGGGYIEALRRIVYFPQVSLSGPMMVVLGWLLFGALCVALGIWYEKRHKPRPLSESRMELEEDVAV